ncbi:MAG: hypothetical protein U0168_25055 [Nannocystaceae bacterium]
MAAATARSSALRRQLHETRRLADLSALERQRLVERVDGLEGDNATLREALASCASSSRGRSIPGSRPSGFDAALSREQSLRWRVAALEREIAELRVRPVDAPYGGERAAAGAARGDATTRARRGRAPARARAAARGGRARR